MIEFVKEYYIHAILGGTVAAVVRMYKKQKAQKEGIQLLLGSNIYNINKDAKHAGFIPYLDKQWVEKLYKNYKTLDGNSIIDEKFTEIKLLPDEKEE